MCAGDSPSEIRVNERMSQNIRRGRELLQAVAERFGGPPGEQPLGAGIPADHPAVEIHGHDRHRAGRDQRVRKRIEEGFAWIKETAGLRKTRHRGTELVGWMFTLTAAAYNLIRPPKIMEPAWCARPDSPWSTPKRQITATTAAAVPLEYI